MTKYSLTPDDYRDDAVRIGCELAAMLAVFEVESSGVGFHSDGTPKTLFEGHIFHRLTKGKFTALHPTLSYPKWTKAHYGKNAEQEKARLAKACELDRNAALMSASWGLPQIMGFNFVPAGFRSLQAFINAMYKDANSQLECFTNFILTQGLDDELRSLNWTSFARQYNGNGQVDFYAGKMKKAYDKFKRQGY